MLEGYFFTVYFSSIYLWQNINWQEEKIPSIMVFDGLF
ncbi:hypothetical protein AsAng_0019580 [Aureispira anguillae]|uniref:Uncharacterized protein n=1 Tax=Aureispira anguillae TaxID=2864201 RepID=A0A916DT58_9BACT|nr:hypothetical protein AsAng_0019580 [Aureispira anguillae]